MEEELKRLDEIIGSMQVQQHKESNSTVPDEIKDINSKYIEIERVVKSIYSSIEELKSSDNFIDSNNGNQQSSKSGNGTLREQIKTLMTKIKGTDERLDKVNFKVENTNQDILQKVRKDFSQESSRLLEEFRGNLRNSITKIQEQMTEKVDKFNLDDFSKKLDLKIVHEFSKKLDRTDLNKNTHVINKKVNNLLLIKIDSLENKISKTLVDALIDLQLDDAPLMVKKSQQGGDKCASCNQHLPLTSSNNMINQFNYINNHAHGDKVDKNTNVNSSSSMKRYSQKSIFESADDNLNAIKLKGNASSINFHLPDLNNSVIHSKSSTKFIKPSKKEFSVSEKTANLKKNLINNEQRNLNNTQSVMNYDEFSEKHLNNLINNELEKKIINPENIMRVTKRVYDNIDKKNKQF